MRPLVSVLVATHNGEATVRTALDLVCNSTYKNIEIIIVDDASTDRTPKICSELAAKDPRVKFFRNEKNLGIVATCNQLVELSNGKYVLWNDQDDVRDVTFVAKAVEILESNSEYVLCHCYTMVEVNGQQVHYTKIDSIAGPQGTLRRYWNMLRTFSDITIYGLIRREALLRTSLWQSISGNANILLYELLLVGPFTQVPEVLFTYQGKGLANRPDVKEEVRRAAPGVKSASGMPWLTIALTQSKGIRRASQLGIAQKIALLVIVWTHTIFINGLKLIYRTSRKFWPRASKKFLFKSFSRGVYSGRDINQIIDPLTRPDIYPPEWPLVNATKSV